MFIQTYGLAEFLTYWGDPFSVAHNRKYLREQKINKCTFK